MAHLHIKPGTTWAEAYARCRVEAPEAFGADALLNLIGGDWVSTGESDAHSSPNDGTVMFGPPRIDHQTAVDAVALAAQLHTAWARIPLSERIGRVTEAVDLLQSQRDLLALLLVWEIGKPWLIALADVDRCIDGVRWYLDQIPRQLKVGTSEERTPLSGPVSNIASWNYPMSVQVHAELVQCLAGNAVVAKTPSQGGFHTLTLAHAIMKRAGLPVTLLSGIGSSLGDVLIRSEEIGALAGFDVVVAADVTVIDLLQVVTEDDHRERGLDSFLTRTVLDTIAATEGGLVIPSCPFVASYIDPRAQYQSLVAV